MRDAMHRLGRDRQAPGDPLPSAHESSKNSEVNQRWRVKRSLRHVSLPQQAQGLYGEDTRHQPTRRPPISLRSLRAHFSPNGYSAARVSVYMMDAAQFGYADALGLTSTPNSGGAVMPRITDAPAPQAATTDRTRRIRQHGQVAEIAPRRPFLMLLHRTTATRPCSISAATADGVSGGKLRTA